MAANQTQPTKVTVKAFIDTLPDEAKRADAKALVKLMQNATGEKPVMWGPAIIGFGSCHYTYDSGREGDMPLVSFSPRKAATVLYNLTTSTDHKELLPKLGKHKVSGGCLHIKKLTDVDPKVLETLVVKAAAATRAQHPK